MSKNTYEVITVIQKYFETLTDPRQQSKVRHNLLETIVMVICAVIADCDVWEDIADYCRVKETWFREALGMELKNGIPSHDTMQRIFEMLDPKEFEKCFAEWVSSVCTKKDRQVISVDGKTVCGSRSADRNPIHMISAWANDAQLVLGQIATDEKSNEITAVPKLLNMLDIEGHIITADAMSCQKEITKTITEKKADYVIGLKENQLSLYRDAEEYFKSAESEPNLYSVGKKTVIEKGHGRIETRVYFLCTDADLLNLHQEWSNLNGIGMMKSRIQKNDATTEETHYYITSLNDVKEVAKAARQHWGVENSLHWCLDMTFNEDYSRTRKDHSAENFAVIRYIALNVLKRMDDKMSVARRRRHCSYDGEYFKKVMLSIHA